MRQNGKKFHEFREIGYSAAIMRLPKQKGRPQAPFFLGG
jgi:hypothetical protein